MPYTGPSTIGPTYVSPTRPDNGSGWFGKLLQAAITPPLSGYTNTGIPIPKVPVTFPLLPPQVSSVIERAAGNKVRDYITPQQEQIQAPPTIVPPQQPQVQPQQPSNRKLLAETFAARMGAPQWGNDWEDMTRTVGADGLGEFDMYVDPNMDSLGEFDTLEQARAYGNSLRDGSQPQQYQATPDMQEPNMGRWMESIGTQPVQPTPQMPIEVSQLLAQMRQPQQQAPSSPITELLRSVGDIAKRYAQPGRPEPASPGSVYGLHPEQLSAMENEKQRQYEVDMGLQQEAEKQRAMVGMQQDENALKQRQLDMSGLESAATIAQKQQNLGLQERQVGSEELLNQAKIESANWIARHDGVVNTKTGKFISTKVLDRYKIVGDVMLDITTDPPSVARDFRRPREVKAPTYDMLAEDGTGPIQYVMRGSEVDPSLRKPVVPTTKPRSVAESKALVNGRDLEFGVDPTRPDEALERHIAALRSLLSEPEYANDTYIKNSLAALTSNGGTTSGVEEGPYIETNLSVGEGGVILYGTKPLNISDPRVKAWAINYLQSQGML